MTHLRVERINDHGRHPNKFISFIKEDRRKTTMEEQAKALGVLNRVAAIVYPIMKDNGLQVTTLEEHPFNDSYAGINYDAGDCIGLVLRTAGGAWVPEMFVLSVMLHELSHCTNMHHAGPFWKTLGLYRSRMAQLRSQGYTGEGFWRAGVQLGTGETASLATAPTELPKALCGGAFKGSPFFRRKRRRTTGSKAAKVVKPGEKLGGDLAVRAKLDGGKSKATPRVVKSKRGRELRASAAEIRFSTQLTEKYASKSEDEETEDEDGLREFKPTWKMEDEDLPTQTLLKDEMQQETAVLQQSTLEFKPRASDTGTRARVAQTVTPTIPEVIEVIDDDDSDTTDDTDLREPGKPADGPKAVDGEDVFPNGVACSICTLVSDPASVVCQGCGTLMDESDSTWLCKSSTCHALRYINHTDRKVCGLCQSPRT